MTTQPSLDPRKNPWKRGDVCTRGFDTVGLVVNRTAEYLEVRWSGNDVTEKIPTGEIEDVLRVAHAESPSPSGQRTNLEALQSLEALDVIESALVNRTFRSEREKHGVDNLIRRAFASDGCKWDKKNSTALLTLALKPGQVGVLFRLRERFHRLVCGRSQHRSV